MDDQRFEGKKGEGFLKAQSGEQGLEDHKHDDGYDDVCFLTCMRAVVQSPCNSTVAVKYPVINTRGWACPNSLSLSYSTKLVYNVRTTSINKSFASVYCLLYFTIYH